MPNGSMPTSTHWAISNSPKIFVKMVSSAGTMWASSPTSFPEKCKKMPQVLIQALAAVFIGWG